jgi:Asp-tRNA(Asn)/Glu-tRNA(Gln) amidotransferase A subunit family amidase
MEEAAPEVRTHTEQVMKRLSGAGAEIEDAAVSFSFEDLLAAHHVIMTSEAADVHSDDFAARADDYAPNVRGLIEDGLGASAVDYLQAKQTVQAFRAELEEAIRGYDVLVTPTTATPAPRDLTTTGPAMFQSPWTASGFPTITLPSGLSESRLPLGIQLGAAPFDESTLLAVARWCEQALEVSLTPPGLD